MNVTIDQEQITQALDDFGVPSDEYYLDILSKPGSREIVVFLCWTMKKELIPPFLAKHDNGVSGLCMDLLIGDKWYAVRDPYGEMSLGHLEDYTGIRYILATN